MKFNFKISLIIGMIGVFLFSTMFCCCITKTAQAKEHKPSCHQTHQETDTSNHDSNECDCHQSTAVIQTTETFTPPICLSAFFSIDQQIVSIKHSFNEWRGDQVFPQHSDSIPLFIKHSILRI